MGKALFVGACCTLSLVKSVSGKGVKRPFLVRGYANATAAHVGQVVLEYIII